MWGGLFENYGDQLIDSATVVFAALICGLIGLEREYSEKPAGFRTHMLVGGASALLVILGDVIVRAQVDAEVIEDFVRTDPIRVIQAIIVGVSFIGAGTVLKVEAEARVHYLTTAASILFAAGIGVAVALEQFILSVSLVIVVLAINTLFGRISRRVGNSERDTE